MIYIYTVAFYQKERNSDEPEEILFYSKYDDISIALEEFKEFCANEEREIEVIISISIMGPAQGLEKEKEQEND